MTDVEHSSQDQDGEYYRKIDVRLGHSRRHCGIFGIYMLNLGCGLGDAGERYYSGGRECSFRSISCGSFYRLEGATITFLQS